MPKRKIRLFVIIIKAEPDKLSYLIIDSCVGCEHYPCMQNLSLMGEKTSERLQPRQTDKG